VAEGAKVSSRQGAFLMANVIFSTLIIFVPTITARHARQDAWISIILAAGAGLLVGLLAAALGRRFPDQTIFEYPAEIVGRWAGKLVGLLYVWWFLHLAAESFRVFGEFLVAIFMPETPVAVLIVLGATGGVYAVRHGLEVITRANEIFLPLAFVSVVVIFILAAGQMNFQRLLPVADVGAVQVFKGAAVALSYFGEIAAIAVLVPYLNKPREAGQVAVAGVLASAAFFLLVMLGILTVYGPDLAGAYVFPTLNETRIISIANFLERLEAVNIVIWITGAYVKICFYLWAAALGSAQVLALKDYRPLVLPLVAVAVAMSTMLHPGILELLDFRWMVWPPYALSTFELGVPLLLLVTALARGKGGRPA